MTKKFVGIGFVLAALLLVVHLRILNDYGLTWDFHHHFFAGMHLVGQPITPALTANLPFTEPDPRGTYKLPFGPLMTIAPVVTYLVFFKWLMVLTFDNAYNLAIVLSGIAGVFFFYLFLLEAFGFTTALAGLAFLALLPRYFGDLHNNMKDVPQGAAFTLALWLFWRLVRHRRLKDLILAIAAFAVACNTKVNTMIVPVIAGAWLFLHKKFEARNRIRIYVYFLLAPLAAFLLWSLFWEHPIQQLLYIPQFFRDNTQNIEVLLAGHWYCSGMNVPWWYPLWYLAITTPLPILLFFLIGLMSLMSQMRQKPLFSLLLLWFFLPLVRYVYPAMGVIDGIRHFEEVVFPLAAIAAIGAVRLAGLLPKGLVSLIGLISLVSLMGNIVAYHPYQIVYYNELVGGVAGAFGKYDLDYWGVSQKEAVAWVNTHAAKNAKVYIAMAADVAGMYLRPDLLPNLNHFGYDGSDYVILLNRQSFLYRYFYAFDYLLTHQPIHTVSVHGVPLTWIFDNRVAKTPRQAPWWTGEDPCIKKYW
ncbi:glycosyltransferase family 39 protein [Candidatus Gottesmanbacteria bacterium]|nr:glycosyltransferase family 39 protein [Candidatus Gottesmanbacteria bacterium]